jgi:hypothetical protein
VREEIEHVREGIAALEGADYRDRPSKAREVGIPVKLSAAPSEERHQETCLDG